MEVEIENLVDSIYESAVVPELWPDVLARLSKINDGAGGLLFTSNLDRIKWTASADIYDLFDEFVRDGWAAINPRPGRLGALDHAGFIRDSDHFTPEELETDPVYKGFYRPRGLGWATGTILNVPSGDSIIFSFEKAYEKGPVETRVLQIFDQLRPHLARAALLASRLGLEKAQAMTATLAKIGLPAAVLRGPGRLYAANPQFQSYVPELIHDRPSRLAFADPSVDRLFADGLRTVAGPNVAAHYVCSIPIPARPDRPPMIVHLMPVRGSARDVFSNITGLIVVTPVDQSVVPNANVLAGLFDLTPAEARVAREIASGRTIEAIAEASGVSRETVRTQLKHVFAKTGLTRQVELAALLNGAGLPGFR